MGQPQESAMVAADTKPPSPLARAAVKIYLLFSKWEHHVASKWLEALAPDVKRRYNARYQELREKLGDLDVGDSGCFLSKTLIINAIVNPHKDADEVTDGLVMTYHFNDDCTGGDQVNLDLSMRFHQEAGDFLLGPSQRCTHMGLPIEDRERYGHAFSMRQNIYQPPKRPHLCDECDKTYASPGGLSAHKLANHPKDSEGNPAESPRYYCPVDGCAKKGATKGYSAPATLSMHMKSEHPGVAVPRSQADKTRRPTSHAASKSSADANADAIDGTLEGNAEAASSTGGNAEATSSMGGVSRVDSTPPSASRLSFGDPASPQPITTPRIGEKCITGFIEDGQ